ncbi:predicted protein [Histoplasma capsulatum var. duboisii H88]|uniref:Predicted protein n=1 Tax=Ajellomyces capsulatus (strain H88) TaxID=544711 RepID=F0UF08_AJEC8|nr:predicted protein [Histoplasma capsulatum var. duboisii H88]
MGRPFVLLSLGLSAILFTAISTIVNGAFAASLENAVPNCAFLTYMAVVLTAISSIVLGLLLVSFTLDAARGRRFWKSWNGLAFVLLGGILSIALIFVAFALRQSDSLLKGEDSSLFPRTTRVLYYVWCGTELAKRLDIQTSLRHCRLSMAKEEAAKADRDATLKLFPTCRLSRTQTTPQQSNRFTSRLGAKESQVIASM